eukprot:CFRG3937T1
MDVATADRSDSWACLPYHLVASSSLMSGTSSAHNQDAYLLPEDSEDESSSKDQNENTKDCNPTLTTETSRQRSSSPSSATIASRSLPTGLLRRPVVVYEEHHRLETDEDVRNVPK